MINIESHCHSYHSFDCNLSIESIVDSCLVKKIKGIVICDHDVYSLTVDEEELFTKNNITVYKAIEFTTKTNAHIIGISPLIKTLERPRFYYNLNDLIEKLISINAAIIIPHPNHITGIVGNRQITEDCIHKTFMAAGYVEVDNYRYGQTKIDYTERYPHLIKIIGSDAHSANNLGAYINLVEAINEDFNNTMQTGQVNCLQNKVHKPIYWFVKAIQKSFVYQIVLNLFPSEMRRYVKNKLLHK